MAEYIIVLRLQDSQKNDREQWFGIEADKLTAIALQGFIDEAKQELGFDTGVPALIWKVE